jgi:hypothetical protein
LAPDLEPDVEPLAKATSLVAPEASLDVTTLTPLPALEPLSTNVPALPPPLPKPLAFTEPVVVPVLPSPEPPPVLVVPPSPLTRPPHPMTGSAKTSATLAANPLYIFK